MSLTKSQLFQRVAADTKGEASAPTEGSTEWNQWGEWLEEEYQSWAEVHDWEELKTNYYVSGSQSGTSVALPRNLKKLAGSPYINGNFYSEVDFDAFDKHGTSSLVVRTGYDPTNDGYYLNIKPALASSTSVLVPIVAYPSPLPSPANTVKMRNPNYLVKRMKVRVFKYTQNPIFTEVEAEADLMLQQMIENEYYKHSQYKGGATTREEEAGFELGTD